MPPTKKPRRPIGRVRQGTLRKFGYSSKASRASRKKAVCAASKRYGKVPIIRKLNFLANMTRKRNPQLSNVYRRDMNVVRKECKGRRAKSARGGEDEEPHEEEEYPDEDN